MALCVAYALYPGRAYNSQLTLRTIWHRPDVKHCILSHTGTYQNVGIFHLAKGVHSLAPS